MTSNVRKEWERDSFFVKIETNCIICLLQIFEYAVGHWLQKAAEHVYGCVLCCPGCFSLFRASALMDDNVMRQYSVKAETPKELVQYDQGVHNTENVVKPQTTNS